MRPSTRRWLTTTAVVVGSLVLFAPSTIFVVVSAAERLTSLAPDPHTVGGLVIWGLAIVAAYEVATEAAAVTLHSFDALDRGGPARRAIRYTVLWLTFLSGVVLVVDFLVEWVRSVRVSLSPVSFALFALVVALFLWATVRTLRSFYAGYVNAGPR